MISMKRNTRTEGSFTPSLTPAIKVFKQLPMTLLALAVLNGCSLAPEAMTPQADVPQTYDATTRVAHQSGSEQASSGQASSEASTALQWQQLSDDPLLLQLLQEVRQQHRSLQQARITLAQLATSVDSASAARLPVLGLAADQSRQRVAADLSTTGSGQIQQRLNAQVGISAFELDLFGRAANAEQAAQAQFYAEAATLRATDLTISTAFVSQYLTLQWHQQQQQLAARTVLNLQERLALITARAEAGVDNELVLAQAKRELAATQVSLAQAEVLVAQDVHALEQMLRRTLTDAEIGRMQQALSQLKPVSAGLPADLMLQRPDVMAAEQRLRATEANIGIARAAYFPSIQLTATAGSASTELSNLFQGGSGSWSFSPRLDLPLWDFGARASQVERAELARDLAVSQYQATVEQAFREVADSLSSLEYGTLQLTAAKEQHQQAMQVLQLTQQREAAGLDSALARLDAQRSWYTAASQQLAQEFQLQLARLTLFKAVGGEQELGADAVAKAPTVTQ